MFGRNLASSRLVRVGVFGLASIAAVMVTSDGAEAHRSHHRHYVHHTDESYSPAFSSIIVDGNSGATLAATSPDAIRHPASLTKIMTLYLLFERMDAGRMKLDTEMSVSEHASEQAPTKLGLRPGQTIRVEDAIKGLVTRSANDAAVVIASVGRGTTVKTVGMVFDKTPLNIFSLKSKPLAKPRTSKAPPWARLRATASARCSRPSPR